MVRLIFLFCSLILTSLFTLLTFWLPIQGQSTIDVINRLPLLIAPTTFVYIIWFFVFILLFVWAISHFKNRKSSTFITPIQTILFVLVMIFQVASIYYWNHEELVYSLWLVGLQLVSLFVLYLTYPLKNEFIKVRIPIAIYFSWTTFLFTINISSLLMYNEWRGFGLSNALWVVIILTFLTAVALHLRYHHYDIAYPAVFVWCFVGIAISNGFYELLVTTSSLFLSGVLVAGMIFMKKNPVRS